MGFKANSVVISSVDENMSEASERLMSVHRVNSDNTGWPESIINCTHIPSVGFVGLPCQSYAKEVLGGCGWGSNFSCSGCRHFASLFTDEEQRKVCW